jgi:hypothetical protein
MYIKIAQVIADIMDWAFFESRQIFDFDDFLKIK